MLLALALGMTLSLASCGDKTYSGVGYTVTKREFGSSIHYNEEANMTYAEFDALIENKTDTKITNLTFMADFKNETGKVICSKQITLNYSNYRVEIDAGSEYTLALKFYDGTESNDYGAIPGKATSVSLRPYSMTVSSEMDDGEKTFGFLEIIIAVLCVGAIVLGIWLTYDGFYLGLDWLRKYPEDIAKPVFGILLILLSIGWAIAYYFFIW